MLLLLLVLLILLLPPPLLLLLLLLPLPGCCRQDFKEIGLLGQGNFSKVFRVRHRFDGREYAVKRTQRAAAPDGPDFVRFIQVKSLIHI
jgi:hypothetical protein